MSDDLVSRLESVFCRGGCGSCDVCLCAYCYDAAEEIKRLRADLARPKVKAIGWVKDDPFHDGWWGNGVFTYQIRKGGEGFYRWRRGLSETWYVHDDPGLEAAKAAAQADYEARILSALEGYE